MYNFFRQRKTRIYIGLGVAYNLSGYGTNRYVLVDRTGNYPGETDDNFAPGKKGWGSVLFRAGTRLNSRWEIGVVAAPTGSIIDYQLFWASPKIYSLRLAWFPFVHS
ncbi:MAG: hypothetical protein P4L51_19820 [Puia sp.]|nr:hypothetical protein [Puia sp.]